MQFCSQIVLSPLMECFLDTELTLEKGNTTYVILLVLEARYLDISLDTVIYCFMFSSSLKLSYLICENGDNKVFGSG